MYVSICFEFDKFLLLLLFDKFCLCEEEKKEGKKEEVMSSTSNVYMN